MFDWRVVATVLDGKHAELCVFLRLCVEGSFVEASGCCYAVSAGGFSLAQLSLFLTRLHQNVAVRCSTTALYLNPY